MRSTCRGQKPSHPFGHAQYLNFTSHEQQHRPSDTPILAVNGQLRRTRSILLSGNVCQQSLLDMCFMLKEPSWHAYLAVKRDCNVKWMQIWYFEDLSPWYIHMALGQSNALTVPAAIYGPGSGITAAAGTRFAPPLVLQVSLTHWPSSHKIFISTCKIWIDYITPPGVSKFRACCNPWIW